DLLETLRAAHGAGLAAPQVGVLKRMFAYDIPPDEETSEHPFGVLVNPGITRWEGEQDGEEGCLSFPGIYYACKRAMEGRVGGGAAFRAPASTTPASGPWRSRWRRWTCAARPSGWTARRCWPAACSTRSTTWTGCCSSSGCPGATRSEER